MIFGTQSATQIDAKTKPSQNVTTFVPGHPKEAKMGSQNTPPSDPFGSPLLLKALLDAMFFPQYLRLESK